MKGSAVTACVIYQEKNGRITNGRITNRLKSSVDSAVDTMQARWAEKLTQGSISMGIPSRQQICC